MVAYRELVLRRVFNTSEQLHQYPGGYHQYCRRMPLSYSVTGGYHQYTTGCATLWLHIMSWSYRGCLVHQSDFISTLEHIISTAEGCHSLIQSATGGVSSVHHGMCNIVVAYRELVLWRVLVHQSDFISTLEDINSTAEGWGITSVHHGMSNILVACRELVLWRVFSASEQFHQYMARGYHQYCRRTSLNTVGELY